MYTRYTNLLNGPKPQQQHKNKKRLLFSWRGLFRAPSIRDCVCSPRANDTVTVLVHCMCVWPLIGVEIRKTRKNVERIMKSLYFNISLCVDFFVLYVGCVLVNVCHEAVYVQTLLSLNNAKMFGNPNTRALYQSNFTKRFLVIRLNCGRCGSERS